MQEGRPNRHPAALALHGREWDRVAGLYQVRARWYDPQTGRFVSEDPIGLAGGMNVYAYAANSPVNFTGPSGLCPPGGCVVVLDEVVANGRLHCSSPLLERGDDGACVPIFPADFGLGGAFGFGGAFGAGYALGYGVAGALESGGGGSVGPKTIVLTFIAQGDDRKKFQGCRKPRVEHYETQGAFVGTWLMNRTNTEAVYPRFTPSDGFFGRTLGFQRWAWYTGMVITREYGIVGAAGYVWCETGDAQFESAPITVP